MFCVEVIDFKVAKSPPTHVNARENPRPETGILPGRALRKLFPEIRIPHYNQDNYFGPKGVRIREIPL